MLPRYYECYRPGVRMAFEFLAYLALALALGFKHSYDADHLVAVSNLLTRSANMRRTATMSVAWAAGHMLTASVITVILFTLGATFFAGAIHAFELGVAGMLIAIGAFGLALEFGLHRRLIPALQRLGLLHDHAHAHGVEEHHHPHWHLGRYREHGTMLGIGIVHGLASNDEILVLLIASFGMASLTIEGLLVGVGVFSLGVVAGMILFGLGLSYPILRWGDAKVRRVVNVATALLSIAYGTYLLAGFEGINLLPFGG